AGAPFTAQTLADFQGVLNNPSPPTGQLWFGTEASSGHSIVGHVNNDGTHLTSNSTAHPSTSLAVDLARGFYFVVDENDLTVSTYRISDGSQVGTSLQVGDFNGAGNSDGDIINALAVDPTTHTLYVGRWGTTEANTGIVQINYDPTTGVLDSSGAFNSGSQHFLLTGTSTGGVYTDAQDFSIDIVNHRLYYVDQDFNFSG